MNGKTDEWMGRKKDRSTERQTDEQMDTLTN